MQTSFLPTAPDGGCASKIKVGPARLRYAYIEFCDGGRLIEQGLVEHAAHKGDLVGKGREPGEGEASKGGGQSAGLNGSGLAG